jgi:pimeloyl-ACP methyl ester carboxylesterase
MDITYFLQIMAIVWEWLRQIWIPTSAVRLAEAERRVLSIVRYPFEQNQVSIGDGLTINTLHTYNPNAKTSGKRSPLVLLHGFGAGIGFWLLNIDALAEQHEHVYAIDLLGCGRSSRPHFGAKTAEEAEKFFVDALERWRIQLNLDKMILLGNYFYKQKKRRRIYSTIVFIIFFYRTFIWCLY